MRRYTPTPAKITLWLILSINFGRKLWVISNLFPSIVIHVQTSVLEDFFFFFSFSDQTWHEICGDAFHFQIIFIDCIVNFSCGILAQQFWSDLGWSLNDISAHLKHAQLIYFWLPEGSQKKRSATVFHKRKIKFHPQSLLFFFQLSQNVLHVLGNKSDQSRTTSRSWQAQKRFLLMIMSEAMCNYTYHFHTPFFFAPFLAGGGWDSYIYILVLNLAFILILKYWMQYGNQ